MKPGAHLAVIAALLLPGCGGSPALTVEEETSDLQVRRVDMYDTRYPRPAPDLGYSGSTVALPDVPAFPPRPTGPLKPADVLRMRHSLLDQRISISGVVTWRRDCVDVKARSNVSRAELRRHLRDNPKGCEPSQLTLANDARSPATTLWVVGGPPLLDIRTGDRVTVSGTWSETSPDGAKHAGGLLIFSAFR